MAEPLWTSDEIAAACKGRLAGAAFAAGGVSIDTRTLEPGDLFVALAGERDGHEFVDAALAKGAAGALTTRAMAGPCVVVDETLVALEHLGEAARDRARKARRGAVTGSVGKTSVTQAIRAGLARAGRSHGSVKSYNNHIGVPLTLARMPRDAERAIFEIGMNHADEITPLARMVRPRAAAITDLVLWIGYLKWHLRTLGHAPGEPLLKAFDNIKEQDAVLAYDRKEIVTDESGKPISRWNGPVRWAAGSASFSSMYSSMRWMAAGSGGSSGRKAPVRRTAPSGLE